MARFEPNKAGIEAMYARIGERLKTTTDRVVRETADLPTEEAATKLQAELAAIGAKFPLAACTNCVETVRRGEVFTFKLQ